jgi:oxalate---CoA ligase
MFWNGYSKSVLVSSRFAKEWSVEVSTSRFGSPATGEGAIARVLPRRWLDLNGCVVQEAWVAGLRAVIGTIVFRPGISQASIRDPLFYA